MIDDVMLKTVNHEAWIEYGEPVTKAGRIRTYVKWGHYPEVEGRLNPQTVVSAFALLESDLLSPRIPVTIGVDRDSLAKGGLFMEFLADKPGVYSVNLEYRSSIVCRTKDGKMVFGEKKRVEELGYEVDEAFLHTGLARTYVVVGGEAHAKPSPLGLGLEVMPAIVKRYAPEEIVEVRVLYEGKPRSNALVTHLSSSRSKSMFVNEHGCVKVKLEKGVNVIVAKYSDDRKRLEGAYDRVSYDSTLTLLAW